MLVAFSALFISARTIALAQTDVSGYWKFSVTDGGLNYLELKQTGTDVYVSGRNGMSKTPLGTLQDNKLHLEIPAPFGPPNPKRVTVYDAVVKGDKFPATKKQPNGDVLSGTLERVTKEEAYPARLPLPESCASCLITDSRARHPWAGIAGTDITTGLTMPRCAEWPTPWSPAA
jgi:hypothetical protein